MATSYDLYVKHEVYETIRSLPHTHRARILAFIEALPVNPFGQGDFTETDRDDRPHQVSVVGKYAVYFWADHAAKEIRVADLVDADRN